MDFSEYAFLADVDFDAPQWDEVLRLAWRWRLLGRLGLRLRGAGEFDRMHFKARDRLESVIARAEVQQRVVRREPNRVARGA